MKLIVCVSNNNGMMFNQRRQSRDKELIQKILEISDGQLVIHPYSKTLFPDDVETKDNPLDLNDNKYAFIEDPSFIKDDMKFNEIIICKWNRDYPADQYFVYDMMPYDLISIETIVGSSHDEIQIERYVLEQI